MEEALIEESGEAYVDDTIEAIVDCELVKRLRK